MEDCGQPAAVEGPYIVKRKVERVACRQKIDGVINDNKTTTIVVNGVPEEVKCENNTIPTIEITYSEHEVEKWFYRYSGKFERILFFEDGSLESIVTGNRVK